ncbi:MAG: TraR/DksA C4-type zinc finger protein [Halanaerobiaceae bacterium]
MNQHKLEQYKHMLLKYKDRLEFEIKNFEDEEKLSQQESTGELSSYDNHPGDAGSETFEREMDLGLKDNTFGLLIQVDDALDKINSGNYGLCQQCGIAIDDDRLEVVPYTSFCEKCKEEQEDLEGVRERPIEEGSYFPPFRSFNDDTDRVEYDGEDTWQDVAQYGTSNDPMYAPDSVTGKKAKKEAYADTDEIVGSVGIEDSLFEDEKDDIEDTANAGTSITGSKGENKR